MTDNVAVLNGYTQKVRAVADEGVEFHLLVKPGTKFDSYFHAWDMDTQEFFTVTGWMFDVEIQ